MMRGGILLLGVLLFMVLVFVTDDMTRKAIYLATEWLLIGFMVLCSTIKEAR